MTDERSLPVATGVDTQSPADLTLGKSHDALTAARQECGTVPASNMDLSDALPDFAHELHTFLQQSITWADAKAAVLLAGSAGILGFLHTQGLTKRIAPTLFDVPNTASNTIGIIAALGLTVSSVAAFASFWPRLAGEVSSGFIFWKAIVTEYKDGNTYATAMLVKSSRALLQEKLRHAWELSVICKRKFRWISVSTIAAAVGASAALIYLAIWMR